MIFTIVAVGVVTKIFQVKTFVVVSVKCFVKRLQHFACNVFHVNSFNFRRNILEIGVQNT